MDPFSAILALENPYLEDINLMRFTSPMYTPKRHTVATYRAQQRAAKKLRRNRAKASKRK